MLTKPKAKELAERILSLVAHKKPSMGGASCWYSDGNNRGTDDDLMADALSVLESFGVYKPPEEFMECDVCRAKPGSPTLCRGCQHNRTLIARMQERLKPTPFKPPIDMTAVVTMPSVPGVWNP